MKISKACLICLGFLVPLPGKAQDHARTIDIPLAMSPSKASNLLQMVALKGGWTVAATSDNMLTLDTYSPKRNGALNIQLKANFIGSDSAVVVMLSGLWGSELEAALLGPGPDRGRPKTPISGPPFKRLNHAGRVVWAELERFAGAVRATTDTQ